MVALMAAMTLGAGTDYAIFLVGRYHEARRGGVAPTEALAQAYRSIAPVVIGSALTVSVALACLVFAQVGSFRSAGLPCAIGILATMMAALTLTPALMSLAIRRGYLEPRPSRTARRWRRVGTAVARWPGPILVTAGGLTLLVALPLAGMRVGFNEPAATPSSTDSNRGYVTADRHSAANEKDRVVGAGAQRHGRHQRDREQRHFNDIRLAERGDDGASQGEGESDRDQRNRGGDRGSVHHQQQKQDETDGSGGDPEHLSIDRGEFVDDGGAGAGDMDFEAGRRREPVDGGANRVHRIARLRGAQHSGQPDHDADGPPVGALRPGGRRGLRP
ncbi:hypothetical protein A5679_06810 [Mycobacterium scrofulaceum]|uniref:SSD domain-containing protein n=1 Tax=Mycobacterium scrofulaceum TaxID=1783 RepID=A0A1A2WAD5_MYCSC|nr:hypothetical protein A5679_06810 [Mycobacterium scrofulaceum]